MENQRIKRILMEELPTIMRQDPEVRDLILRVSRNHFADKEKTESRFDRLLDELRIDREKNMLKWEEQNRKWHEQNERLKEHNRKLEEQDRKWEAQDRRWHEQNERLKEHNRKLEEQDRKWEAQDRRWEEQNRRWRSNEKRLDKMIDSIQALARKHDSTIGALGARWGLHTEESFRNALKGILTDFFDVQVLNITEYDSAGEVFGKPDQVELDIIVKNGRLVISEIKSSMSRSDMYAFERKARFYEKLHNEKADRLLVISPMVDPRAHGVADKLDIEVYTHADDAGAAISGRQYG